MIARFQGTSPYAYAHGNAFNPVSPFDFRKIDSDDVKPDWPYAPGSRRRAPEKKKKMNDEQKNAFYSKFYDKLPQ